MNQPTWVNKAVVLALHEEQLAEHGGAQGLRDGGLLESALARPQNSLAYGNPDVADLAAAYAFGLVANHPFTDGNKRTSAVVTELFLHINGFALEMDDTTMVTTWLSLAAGQLSESELAERIRSSVTPVPKD